MDRTLPYEECLLNAKEKEAQRRARLQADRSRPATKVGCCFPLPLRHTLRSPTTSPPAPEQTEQKGRDPPGPPDGEPGHRARRPGSQRRRCVVLFNPLNPQLLTKTKHHHHSVPAALREDKRTIEETLNDLRNAKRRRGNDNDDNDDGAAAAAAAAE